MCPSDAKLNVTVSPSNLPIGEYNATVTITPVATGGAPAVLHLTFRVTTGVITVQSLPILGFFMDPARTLPPPATIKVTGSGDNVPFTVTVPGDWVSVTPMSGTAPANLTVTADPAAFPASGNGPSGHILISGPANSYDIFTNLGVSPPPAASPSSLTFWAKFAGKAPAAQIVSVYPSSDTVAVSTADGGSWLTGTLGYQGLSISVNQAGLAAGTYRGVVSASNSSHLNYTPAQVSVTLIVWNDAPAITATPSSLEASAASGSGVSYSAIDISSSGLPVEFTFTVSTDDGEPWLNPNPSSGRGQLGLTISATNLPPGVYHGQLTITAPAGSPTPLVVPIKLTVTDAVPPLPPYGPPLGISIVNAASQITGAVSPGEILSIFGLNIGPPQPAGFALDANGVVSSTLGGARVLFDRIPAPLLYASPTQVNAAVPYEVTGRTSVEVTMEYNETGSLTARVPVNLATPGIFTADGSGVGQAEAVNADGKANGPSDPAFRGSTILIFATGLGATIPPSTTGEIASGTVEQPALPVSVTIGGLSAPVVDTVTVPGQLEGLFQIHVVVPIGVAAGTSVPIVLKAGAAQSPSGATIAVQ